METIKAFFGEYGYSFLMMVVIGFVVAIITEITLKKALNWLEGKLAGHERLIAALNVVRTVLIQCMTWIMVIVFTKLLVDTMPLPGSAVLWPVWLCLVYIVQYVFSMYGIKGILKIKDKEKEPKQPKEKKVKVNPVEGMTKISRNCYKDPVSGNFYDRKGNQL